MGFITIGAGKVYPLHHQKFNDHGIKCIGIIETDEAKHSDLVGKGFKVYKTYEEAATAKPAFWDITCPSDNHVNVIEKIIKADPNACILVEKPICQFEEIDRLKEIIANFKGKIVVNENYLSSEVTKRIKSIVEKQKIEIKKISIEMSKNRTKDFLEGRYIDPNGAFYYEGTHMVTILNDVLGPHIPTGNIRKIYQNLTLNDRTLLRQGSAEIAYEVNGVSVTLFTSMKGDIKFPYPPVNPKTIPVEDTSTRYRIASVEGINQEGQNVSVVGFYEPIKGYQRSQGFVSIIKEGQVQEPTEVILDDTMGLHLKKAADYFKGTATTNPSTIEEGISVVETLNRISP
jgi:predicted dehydrogenase